MNKLSLIIVILLCFVLPSCTSVKAYQKMYLNDVDMQLSDSPIENFEMGFQTYREGVSGGNGGKTGGGCGCN
ncbi:MAG: DUF4266 domain-containing protein [Chitinophagales bacterium]|nr:DUF4266 domain-containing protein [Chitinophagales bacterium]